MTSDSVQTAATVPGAATDGISSWSENPLLHVTRLCLSFLQGLFEQAPDGHFHWVDNMERSEIIITDESPLQSELINKRPAVVTVRSPVAFAGIALEQLQSMSIRTGERVHTDMIAGHMTFNCLSSKKVEAEQLGWLVGRHLWILHRIFLQAGFHKFGERIQILAASPAGAIIQGDSQGEILNVPVVVPIFFQWTEKITPLNLRVLQGVEARMTVSMARPLGRSTMPAEAMADGSKAVTGTRVDLQRGRVVRPPHIKGRPVVTQHYPGGQPADPPVEVRVVVEE